MSKILAAGNLDQLYGIGYLFGARAFEVRPRASGAGAVGAGLRASRAGGAFGADARSCWLVVAAAIGAVEDAHASASATAQDSVVVVVDRGIAVIVE